MQRSFMSIAFSVGLAAVLASACSGASAEVAGEELPNAATSSERPSRATEAGAEAQPEAVASAESDLMDIDHDNTGGTCKSDCMDKCEAGGGGFSECSSHCKKACTGAGCNGNNWAACGAGSNSSSPFLCHFMNKVWETTCKNSGVLEAFCIPFGGCSGCRKQMDKNC
jgi:hypothetical protein